MHTIRQWMRLMEAHHAYDEFDYNSRFQPLRRDDTVRVFHGFHAISDAIKAATQGLSGKQRAERRFSYEYDNNPHGLFVTLSLDAAKDFTSKGAIIEFTCPATDLESPVWPSGGYTVQGQMAQYFGHGAPGRAARHSKRREMTAQAQEWAKGDPEYRSHILQSDDPLLAHMLTTGREYQALYVGHLNPEHITAFWVSEQPEKDGRYATWKRLSRAEFLEAYPTDATHQSRRMFTPDEPFNGDEFVRRLSVRFKEELVLRMLESAAEEIRRASSPADRFLAYFDAYLWPKQYPAALRWLVHAFKNSA